MKAMSPIRLTMKSCVSAALGFALGVSLLAISSPARAGDDDVSFDTKIFRSIMSSLGLKRADDAAINYEERPPLVIPSDHSLPPPQQTDAAVNNPAWPKDPDVTRRKLQAAQERDRNFSEEYDRESRPLRPDELIPGARDPAVLARARRHEQVGTTNSGNTNDRLMPSELGFQTGMLKRIFSGTDNEAVRFTGEPPRTSLTAPPSGYQTPSPDQPYGVGQGGPPKPTDDYTKRGELVR
jgi:hypothetical protein